MVGYDCHNDVCANINRHETFIINTIDPESQAVNCMHYQKSSRGSGAY